MNDNLGALIVPGCDSAWQCPNCAALVGDGIHVKTWQRTKTAATDACPVCGHVGLVWRSTDAILEAWALAMGE
jgi:hypothetical protein